MQNNQLAFIFPGQGSQSLNMLAGFQNEKLVQETFNLASQVLGYDLWQLITEDPKQQLNQTAYTQPAILASSVAMWRSFQPSLRFGSTGQPSLGLGSAGQPSLRLGSAGQSSFQIAYLAGHSLGEYSALVCAGSLAFEEALETVALRGQLMQEAVPEGKGAMAAIIGLTDEQIEDICQQASLGAVVEPANFNAPGQIVISGETQAVERAVALAKAAGSKLAKLLPVSVPSHCALMKPAADKLAEKLGQINIEMPKIPVLHNYNVAVSSNVGAIREALIAQLYSPVRWIESIRFLENQGVTVLVECGPGKVLAGLNKRICADQRVINFSDSATLVQALESL